MVSEALSEYKNINEDKENHYSPVHTVYITQKEDHSFNDICIAYDSNYLNTPIFSPYNTPSPFKTPKSLRSRDSFVWAPQTLKTPPQNKHEFLCESPSLMLNLETPKKKY